MKKLMLILALLTSSAYAQPAPQVPADNMSNSISTERNMCMGMVYDGSTWDRWTGAVSLPDVVATGTLDSLNDVITVALAGRASVGFHIDAGTLAGTVSWRLSLDGGTTWTQTGAIDMPTGARVGSFAYTNPNSADDFSVIAVGGATHAQVLLNPFTSGSATARMIATNNIDPFALSIAAQPNGSPQSTISMAIAGTDGSIHRSIRATNADPGGTEYGLIVRLPAGNNNIGDVDVNQIAAFPDNEPFNVSQWGGTSLTAAAALADNASNPTPGYVGSFGMLWDGSTWDRQPGNSTDGAEVFVSLLPNEGQQTAANSISVTPDTDNDAIGAIAAAPPGEVLQIAGVGSGADAGQLRNIIACSEFVAVDIVTATTTLVITGVANRHVYICAINLVSAGANNVAMVMGTGATCGTSTAGMNGGVTAAEGWNFAANGGISQGVGLGAIMSTNATGGATGDSVCIITSAAVQLSGMIGYAIF